MTVKFPLFKTQINVALDETDADKRRRKHRLRNKRNNGQQNEVAFDSEEKKSAENKDEVKKVEQPVLMVEVENVQHLQYKQTEEIKALTQEVIKTIRDIITMNPLYRYMISEIYFYVLIEIILFMYLINIEQRKSTANVTSKPKSCGQPSLSM